MRNVFTSLLAVALVSAAITADAGPTIIRDDRIKDIAMTPWLGRGYTMVTNTFQSKCLENIVITEPSYDFTYTFQSIETSSTKSSSTDASLGAKASYLGINMKLKSKYTNSNNETMNFHHIFVEIVMDTYYASVDESKSRLSASASSLLTNNDIPGFFSSCGTYYVRSLGRNARFVSVFSYSDKSTSKDSSFETELELMVKRMGVKAGIESKVSGSVSAKAAEKSLTITTNAYGLGKNEGATLISYDIETFRNAIKDAFVSMQNPMTGKVTSMEIVPWVENTEFQNLVPLEKEVPASAEDASKSGSDSAKAKTPAEGQKGSTMPLFQKKYNLTLNGEYLAEIERADRNFMNIYYKAKICKQTIEANWGKQASTTGNAQMQLRDEYAGALIQNNKHPSETMQLKKLYDEQLKDVDKYLDQEFEFMYKAAAMNCIDEMLKGNNMIAKSWRFLPTCVKIRGMLSGVLSQTIDDYCMPKLVTTEAEK